MPTDLRIELTAAAGSPPPFDPDAVRRRAGALRRRNRFAVSSATVALVAVVVVAGLQVGARPGGVSDHPDGSVLELPAPGATTAAYLADGRPVFVVHHPDGAVTVLDAVSTHMEGDRPYLLGWCPAGRHFEGLVSGEVYSEFGMPVAGPAGDPLTAYRHEPLSETSVLVPRPLSPDTQPRPEPAERLGEHCSGGHGPTHFFNPGTTLRHTFDGVPHLSLAEAMADGRDGPVVIEDGVITAGEPPTACLDPSTVEDGRCAGPPATGVLGPAEAPALLEGDYLARVSADRVEVIVFTGGWRENR